MQLKYLAAAVLFAAIPVAAHHSFSAAYDAGAPVTITGVVSKIEWSNPHVYIYVERWAR